MLPYPPRPNLVLSDIKNSKLYARLAGEPELQGAVKVTQELALDLLSRTQDYMPLYTFHNERHILNIVAWMDWLVEDAEKLAPLEAALCLLSACTHDLGMTLSDAEWREIRDGNDREFERFRQGYPEELERIALMDRQGARSEADLIEGHLLTEYLRRTHSDEAARRMRTRIREILGEAKFDFRYGGIDYREELELISISHNSPVDWLRRNLGQMVTSTRTTEVNLAYPGLVLRLADILDFDSSRTPPVLFRHLGLDREAHEISASDFVRGQFETSQNEWRKHLSITGIRFDGKTLTYDAPQCPHPAVHKSILDFVKVINTEIDAVRGEKEQVRADRPLRLPKVECQVIPRGGSYVFHDWSFHMDQHAVMDLLMGEALYGDPSLCIRELLQNALDAVELRDLRLQMKKRGKQTERVMGTSPKPGFCTDENGNEHVLEVSMTWGQDAASGRWWIEVSDTGVGMTASTIQRFFTTIGKSFYKSPDFSREQQAMRDEGLLCTPISCFGIGVLSCFMIADRIEVRTRSGDGVATDFHVTGPGSLFWAKAGTRVEQGTDVKVWLKPQIQGEETRLAYDRDSCIENLREFFDYPVQRASLVLDGLDPAEIAARHVVWPRYRVRMQPPGQPEPLVIDDLFHVNVLCPLDVAGVVDKAQEWDIPLTADDRPAWGVHDWTDPETGSRLRLWFPQCGRPNGDGSSGPGDGAIPFWQLGSLAESTLRRGRERLLVASMDVPDTSPLLESLGLGAAPGCFVWLDHRGFGAALRLKADRTSTIHSAGLQAGLDRLWEAIHQHLQESALHAAGALLTWGLPQLVRRKIAGTGFVSSGFKLDGRAQFFSGALTLSLARDRDLDLDLALDRDLDLDLARDRDLDLALDRDRALTLYLDGAFDRDRALARTWLASLGVGPDLLAAHFLQEGFCPNLRESWPPLGVYSRDGMIGDAELVAPAECRFDIAPAGSRLDLLEYDLCFPLTVTPLAPLRRRQPEWIRKRTLRRMGALPFLFPGNSDVWRREAGKMHEKLGIDFLYSLIPAHNLWWKPFSEWTEEDLANPENISIYWDVKTGAVTAAEGTHPRDKMPGAEPFDDLANRWIAKRKAE